MAKFPAKIAGQHRFMVVATFPLDQEMLQQIAGGPITRLRFSNQEMATADAGCIDCEKDINHALADPNCPAPAAPEIAGVTEAPDA